MEVAQGERQLRHVVLGSLLGEPLNLSQMRPQLSSRHKPHNEVQPLIGLEAFVNVDDEGELELIRYLFLLNYTLHFIVLKNLVLSHTFNCMVLFCFIMLSKEDFAEAALANLFEHLVVIDRDRAKCGTAKIEVQILIIIIGVGDNT